MPSRSFMEGSQFEFFEDQGVVAIAAVDALGGVEVVVALQLDAGDLLDDVDQLIDGDQLAGAEVDRLDGCRCQRSCCVPLRQSSMYMKVRVWWPSPQISISCLPERLAWMTLRQMAAGAFSRPPVAGAVWAVDVVKAGDAAWSGRNPRESAGTCARRRASPSRSRLRAWPDRRLLP